VPIFEIDLSDIRGERSLVTAALQTRRKREMPDKLPQGKYPLQYSLCEKIELVHKLHKNNLRCSVEGRRIRVNEMLQNAVSKNPTRSGLSTNFHQHISLSNRA